MEENERKTIEDARRGDTEAFGELVRLHGSRIHAIAYRMTGNADDARDVAQEAFVRLHASLGTYDGRFPLATWLYRMTVNIAIDYRRRSARHRHVPLAPAGGESPLADGRPAPDALLERSELSFTVERLSRDLPERQREVFVLRDLQDFTTAEIAEILECRESTVRVHLARARERIRRILTETYPEYSGGDRS